MHAVPLMWMVFSGFFTWFAGLPLVPGIQDKFGLLQILLPGVLLAVCTIRTAAVRLTSFNITA